MDRVKRTLAYEDYLDEKLPIEKSADRVGGTMADSFDEKHRGFGALDELDTIRRMYELMHAVPEARRARVFQYLSQLLGDD